ncbi:hypothetical protein NL676_007055 [Syzygium grande]|nr:hypothetical protein NL676_007055 [Syzygium grande]
MHPHQPVLKKSESQVRFYEHNFHDITHDVPLRLELEGFVPRFRVSAKTHPAQKDLTTPGDAVAATTASDKAMCGTLKGAIGEPKGLPSTCLILLELWDIGLLD